ncbi:TolB family protein [Agromyces sp. NPDC058136]|uniref:TolB family protein n=1 Tax=Agromyces sp. NPDC058136 TaxID=3346354 RepID=UPI0036DC49A5
MSLRLKWALVVVAAVVLLGGSAAYGVSAFLRLQEGGPAQVAVEPSPLEGLEPGRIVFRSTAAGDGYGLVGAVPVDDPGGPRALADLACDRVDATAELLSCLHTRPGVVTGFEWRLYDATFGEVWGTPLPGLPSRTRVSDGTGLVASTTFVAGHSYAVAGFSTATVIRGADDTDHGNLEDFDFTVNGEPVTAADRNFWGVTFIPDTDGFYATAASGGRIWLVRGDLGDRTLEAIRDDVECPSLSPDGTRIAYKKTVADTSEGRWAIAVLDLASGEEVVLSEKRNVDDQVEWLDDERIVYGLPREGAEGDSDVWSVAADGAGEPELVIEHAWSPSVVR